MYNKLEEFEKEVAKIAEMTGGRVVLQVKSANFNPGSKSRSYRDMYSDKTRRMIAVAFEKDIDMFKYSF